MGGKTTKEINGDAEVNIINNLETHKVAHDKHELLLWIILTCVVILLLIKLIKLYNTYVKNNNLRTAKFVNSMQTV